jgi:hypothetical protein
VGILSARERNPRYLHSRNQPYEQRLRICQEVDEMREVTARKEHICNRCKKVIKRGDRCIQSQSPSAGFWHLECAPDFERRTGQGPVLFP